MIDIEVSNAWRKENPRYDADAVEFWLEHGLLIDRAVAEKRSEQLVLVGYDGDKLAGIATAVRMYHEPLRHHFMFYRVAIDPEYRRQQVMTKIAAQSVDILQPWFANHPQEEVAGLLTVYDAPYLRAGDQPATSEIMNFVLCGYNPSGRQIRVRWFDHARV